MNQMLFEEDSKEVQEDLEVLKSQFENVKKLVNQHPSQMTEQQLMELPEEERKVVEEQKAIDEFQSELERVLLKKTANPLSNYASRVDIHNANYFSNIDLNFNYDDSDHIKVKEQTGGDSGDSGLREGNGNAD